MLKEALELIQRTAVRASSIQKLHEHRNGRTVVYGVNDLIKEFDLGVPPRAHFVTTRESLVAFVSSNNLDDYSMWCDDEMVTLLCNHADRQDKVTLQLLVSRQFIALRGMEENGGRFGQRDFVRMLSRIFGLAEPTVAPFRRLDFHVLQVTEGDVRHGKDRIGKSVNAEVKGTIEIPEEIIVTVPIYETPGETDRYPVRLLIDLDAQRSEIICVPEPGELRMTMHQHQVEMIRRLRQELGEEARIYQGRP